MATPMTASAALTALKGAGLEVEKGAVVEEHNRTLVYEIPINR